MNHFVLYSVGQYPSLVLDGKGLGTIAYYDVSNLDLLVARQNGNIIAYLPWVVSGYPLTP